MRQAIYIKQAVLQLLTIFILFLSFSCQKDETSKGSIMWDSSFGGSADEWVCDISKTQSGGYLVTGQSFSKDGDMVGNAGFKDVLIVKIDDSGNKIWTKSFGRSSDDIPHAIVETSDLGVIVTLSRATSIFSIVKLDSNQNIEWEKKYVGVHPSGGTSIEGYTSIIKTRDDNYLIATNNNRSIWLIKINENGDVIWEKKYNELDSVCVKEVIEVENGFVIVGNTTKVEDQDFFVMHLNQEGEINWSNKYGGNRYEKGTSISQRSNGNFIVAGVTYSTNFDDSNNVCNGSESSIGLLEIDSTGNLIWKKCFGGSDLDGDRPTCYAKNDHIFLTFKSHSSDGDLKDNNGWSDFIVLKIGYDGKVLESQNYGGRGAEFEMASVMSDDDNMVFAGASNSSDADISNHINGFDFWVLKVRLD